MSVKLLTEHHLEFLRLKGGCKARLSLFMSKRHIVGNHMSRLKCCMRQIMRFHNPNDFRCALYSV